MGPVDDRDGAAIGERLCHKCRLATGARAPGDIGLEGYIDKLTQELHQRVEHQRYLFRRLIGAEGSGELRPAYCPLVDCPRLKELRAALRETISVLEETKGSFKSRRLEVMRKKLTDILTNC